MTLQQFRDSTAHLDGDTDLLILTPWGEYESATFLERDDLGDSDPARDAFPDNAVLLTGDAD